MENLQYQCKMARLGELLDNYGLKKCLFDDDCGSAAVSTTHQGFCSYNQLIFLLLSTFSIEACSVHSEAGSTDCV